MAIVLTSHMSKLLTATLKITSVFWLNSILNSARDGIIDTQDWALDKFDLSGRVASEAISHRKLSLPPSFGGASLTSRVRRWSTIWYTIHSSSVFVTWSSVIITSTMIGFIVSCWSPAMVCSICLSQAIMWGRSDRRCDSPGVGIIKWANRWAFWFFLQQRPLSLVFGAVSMAWWQILLETCVSWKSHWEMRVLRWQTFAPGPGRERASSNPPIWPEPWYAIVSSLYETVSEDWRTYKEV